MNASLIVMTTGLVQLITCVCLSLTLGVFEIPTNPGHFGLLALLGLLSYASHMSLTWSLKLQKAGPFAVLRTGSDILFSFLLQFLVLSVIPDLYRYKFFVCKRSSYVAQSMHLCNLIPTNSGIGAAVVTSAVLLTIFKKWMSSHLINGKTVVKFDETHL